MADIVGEFLWSPFPRKQSTKVLKIAGKIQSILRSKIRVQNSEDSGTFSVCPISDQTVLDINLAANAQKFCPVPGLGSRGRLLGHFQIAILYWMHASLRQTGTPALVKQQW